MSPRPAARSTLATILAGILWLGGTQAGTPPPDRASLSDTPHGAQPAAAILNPAAGSSAGGDARTGSSDHAALAVDLDRILADSRLRGAQVGVVVRETATGKTLYDRGGDDRLLPASNAKLLTAMAALRVLGPDYRFVTDVSMTGRRHGPVLYGDLYLRGTGDPTVRAVDYERLAAEVAATGIRVVHGRLRTDDSWFDRVRLGAIWAWDDEPYYYQPQISALTLSPNTDFDSGTVEVRVQPSVPGRPPVVELMPETGYVHVENRAMTGRPGTPTTITVERRHGSNVVDVTGSIPAGTEDPRAGPGMGTADPLAGSSTGTTDPPSGGDVTADSPRAGTDVDAASVTELATVSEPTGLAADVFRRALSRHGVHVLHATTDEGVVPPGTTVLARRYSIPLAELLVPFMKLSNNGIAEILVKAMGRERHGEGSWPAGLRVLTTEMAELGLDPAGYRMADGSGLSRMDMVTAGQVSQLLLAARTAGWFDTFRASLPVAGQPDRMVGGTLRNRMRGTPAAGNVRAKTGSLTGVSALSGYVTAADGRLLVFSILLNNHLEAVRDIEDSIAIRLATHHADRNHTAAPHPVASPKVPDDPRTRTEDLLAGSSIGTADLLAGSSIGTADLLAGSSISADESMLECSWTGAC
ncbi:D-alanyl-D-alanine carboxypeptidase DacC [Longimycelium tulufanense]|uniref:D-alanyl-D-alanine carboxypeptidase DacC n=1 Tax=Longimycelium tulufanense TaxID=907463 RepID=A0A8J3C9V5_9PSEU|nr:D-alanyl-D-alanine carboxypeptidase/D-alanyl-D-alanine-endopeptidase [Longimycelium tulufanense]GGM36993.1 D-alanyl-D-alanine carboxypeptidase DacC [Longimycelium tulufanense]